MSTSYTFLFQPPRAIVESDLRLFRANRALTLVRISRCLLEVEGPEEDLKALASALGPDWVSHPTSTTPFPGPEVGHPVPMPDGVMARVMSDGHGGDIQQGEVSGPGVVGVVFE